MYKVVVESDSTYGREYDIEKRMTALQAAKEYGRHEGGEIVMIFKGDKLIDEARCGSDRKYFKCFIPKD